MKFFERFKPKPEFILNPEFEGRVTKINKLIAQSIIVAHENWQPLAKEHPPEVKSQFETLKDQMKALAREGGPEFIEYLRPWKGKKQKECKFEDWPRVRVADAVIED